MIYKEKTKTFFHKKIIFSMIFTSLTVYFVQDFKGISSQKSRYPWEFCQKFNARTCVTNPGFQYVATIPFGYLKTQGLVLNSTPPICVSRQSRMLLKVVRRRLPEYLCWALRGEITSKNSHLQLQERFFRFVSIIWTYGFGFLRNMF